MSGIDTLKASATLSLSFLSLLQSPLSRLSLSKKEEEEEDDDDVQFRPQKEKNTTLFFSPLFAFIACTVSGQEKREKDGLDGKRRECKNGAFFGMVNWVGEKHAILFYCLFPFLPSSSSSSSSPPFYIPYPYTESLPLRFSE